MEQYQQPDFDSIKQTNVYGVEYWSARDLMRLLGYGKNWQNFETAIQKAMISCEEAEQEITNHFNASIKMVSIGSGAEREIKDYLLSRLACYLIAMNGNPRKTEVAAAQQYFAISTRANEMHQLRKQQEERLELRLQVADGNTKLAEAASSAGVQSENFSIFNDAGYLGLYTMTSEDIRVYKGIPEGEDILDNMGRAELAANSFRITQTEEKLVRDEVQGENNAIHVHYSVGHEIRKTIETLKAPLPEDLPRAASIRKLVEERRRKTRTQKKLKSAPPADQDTLF